MFLLSRCLLLLRTLVGGLGSFGGLALRRALFLRHRGRPFISHRLVAVLSRQSLELAVFLQFLYPPFLGLQQALNLELLGDELFVLLTEVIALLGFVTQGLDFFSELEYFLRFKGNKLLLAFVLVLHIVELLHLLLHFPEPVLELR